MDCDRAIDQIEAVAAGDVALEGALRDHIESCPRCASALAAARRIEATLASWTPPAAPAAFAATVLQRVRRERWQAEQHVDRLFNVAIVVSLLVVATAIAGMFNLDAVWALTGSAWELMREGARESMRQAAPTIGAYAGGAALLASAVLMWWWAERRVLY